jgi:hypothetical protein
MDTRYLAEVELDDRASVVALAAARAIAARDGGRQPGSLDVHR